MTGAAEYPFKDTEPLRCPAEFIRRQDEEPVGRVRLASGEDAWLVTRYADIRGLLGDPRFRPWVPGTGSADGGGLLFTMSGPAHARLRRIAAKALTPRRIELLRPRLETLAAESAAKLISQGQPADVLNGFAIPFALASLSELLGVPQSVRDELRSWTDSIVAVFTAPSYEEMAEAAQKLGGYLAELVETKRNAPGDDLLTGLIEARDDSGDSLRPDEITQLAFAIVIAGYVPPSNALAQAVLRLAVEPALPRDPAGIPALVEELLRQDQSSATDQGRVAVEDAEIGGVPIRAGEFVLAPLRAGNHDRRRFPEPELVDPARTPGHLTFGHGPHHCLGAALARTELQAGLTALLAAAPRLRLAVPFEELAWRRMFLTLRGPVDVPVTW
ncbi:cytochrome P450 [Amycolatopsis roodepoortensis]|uniref:cytochrome P450 n=1 Tax=Amycolatopsis roodepoortensis TaxID=700274 RepID=UPI00214C79EA|nr:cytochrome P450 [Amycolatopsis roodepoortensis]UUV31480.1 cytochrome P450 [Amycolatopsis roodepoortensis]